MISVKLCPPIRVVVSVTQTGSDQNLSGVALTTVRAMYGNEHKWEVESTHKQGDKVNITLVVKEKS